MDTSKKETYFTLRYRLARLLVFLLLRPFIKAVRGLDHLPKEGAFIAAANHCSLMDGGFIGAYVTQHLKRHMHFLAKTSYKQNPLLRWLTETTQSIWMEHGQESRAMLLALEYLKEGKVVAIFPEGTRSINGKLRQAHPGVGALALASKAPVVPIGVIGTHKVFPKGRAFFHPAHCEMNIGNPIRLDAYYPAHDEAVSQKDQEKMLKIEKEATRAIMQKVAKLSNQEYPY